MYFYIHVYHSVGHKLRIARIKIRVDSRERWGKSLEGMQF